MKQHSLPPLDLARVTAEECLTYFTHTFELYESLFRLLASDDVFYMQPEPLRRILLFYLGHTAAFYIIKLRLAGILSEPVDAWIERQFEVGVDEMSWDDLSKDTALLEVPVSRIWAYRSTVKQIVSDAIRQSAFQCPISWNSREWVFVMGIEHERIHLETSCVLFRQLDLKYLKTDAKVWPAGADIGPTASTTPINSEEHLHVVQSQDVVLGKPRDFPVYGWDVEYGRQDEHVPQFYASKFLATNAEYLRFVQDSGYANPSYWSEEGWTWVQFKKASHPVFWVPSASAASGPYRLRILLDIIDLPLSWPVEVNHYEATAYCKWLTAKHPSPQGTPYRLVSEPEWHSLWPISRLPVSRGALSDVSTQANFPANFMLRYGSSTPVDHFPANDRGFHDVFGNVWCWTSTDNLPFNGFEPHPLYLDFSSPCFDYRHTIFVGGSWVSTGNEASQYARYAFRRHFFQFAGFRVACDAAPSSDMSASSAALPHGHEYYETKSMLDEYLLFHYGSAEEIAGPKFAPFLAPGLRFPQRLAELAIREAKARNLSDSALDLGCAVGASSFDMANYFDRVVGIDFSSVFVQACQALAKKGEMPYERVEEGSVTTQLTARVPDFHNLEKRVSFLQGDACDSKLPARCGAPFDVVLAANLVDRVNKPKDLVCVLSKLVSVGGIVVLTSPFTWMEKFSATEDWLGGKPGMTGGAGIAEEMAKYGLALVREEDMPFVIREHSRKFQFSFSHAMVFEKMSPTQL
jgi:5-histidylcysteine sulfoxide synthase/putative 4-mercaptohistidine N1-methyltranferase